MPTRFYIKPKGKNFFRPPSKIKADKEREKKMSPQYARACGIRNSQAWKNLRDSMVRHNPVCEWCTIKSTRHVHHIVPLAENGDLGFTKTNLLCLCQDCHNTIHAEENRGRMDREKQQQIASERESGTA